MLEHGANPHATTSARLTPLHLAARCGSLTTAELLISRGAAIDIGVQYPLIFFFILIFIFGLGCVRDWTPLHHACASGHLSVASLLIDHGAEVNRVDAVCKLNTIMRTKLANYLIDWKDTSTQSNIL